MGPRTAWPARHGDRGAVDDQKTFAVLGCTKRRGWGVDMRVTSAVPAMLMTRRRDQLKWPLHRIPALGKQKSDLLCTAAAHGRECRVRAGQGPRSVQRPTRLVSGLKWLQPVVKAGYGTCRHKRSHVAGTNRTLTSLFSSTRLLGRAYKRAPALHRPARWARAR